MTNSAKRQFTVRLLITVFISFFKYQLSLAQLASGTVVDFGTLEPLAYVHIGITDKGTGTISDENGRFNLELDKDDLADTLTFSMIGYKTLRVAMSRFMSGTAIVKMEPLVIHLKGVVIQAKKIREQLRFGRIKPTKTTTGASGSGNYGIGQEIGTTIKTDGGKYLINAISFHSRWNTVDSILYRINIYALKNELPDTSILQKELFVMTYKRDKWVTRQLEEEIVLSDRDVFVSIELVRRWNNDGDNLLFYSHGEGHREWKSYIRSTSQAEWTTDLAIPLTLYLTVEKLE